MTVSPEQSAWECAARALLAHDAAALEAACRKLPGAAARALADVAALSPGKGDSLRPGGLPESVVWIGDDRFAALFARGPAVFDWETPGRELVTGCYVSPGGRAEFRLEAGECRFVVLRRRKGYGA